MIRNVESHSPTRQHHLRPRLGFVDLGQQRADPLRLGRKSTCSGNAPSAPRGKPEVSTRPTCGDVAVADFHAEQAVGHGRVEAAVYWIRAIASRPSTAVTRWVAPVRDGAEVCREHGWAKRPGPRSPM